ncbi:hypothetical protein LSUE1_G009265, partial [Lachnellula suecica]
MKTAKALPADLSGSRRAQPLRQTRTNPPRSSIPGARAFASRGSLDGLEEKGIEIFPAITHFADAMTALPQNIMQHFTLLKEVDAKIFAPEKELGRLVDHALNAPPPERRPHVEPQHALGPTSAPMSAQGSVNGSIINGRPASVASVPDADVLHAAYDPANIPRRQLFQQCAYTMQNMLVSLDEKNHVISTAAEALNKQLARIDDCWPHVEMEVSEEAKYGSNTHWAYLENRIAKTGSGGGSRSHIQSVNNLSAAGQQVAEEAAARSDARKQALLAKKSNKHPHGESDFDDHHDGRHKEKKLHGNSKIRKAADASRDVGLGITNGGATNGNAPKRRKVEKGPSGGVVMERAMSGVFGTNGTATKGKASSPRETPGPDGPKKRSRGGGTTNGQTRKRHAISFYALCSITNKPRNNTLTSAMSPSIASSPVRSTFPETVQKALGRGSPAPTNGARPASSRARQNSTQSVVENSRQRESSTSKQNGKSGTPDLAAAAAITGRSIPEVKASMKESASNSKGEHMLEDVEKEEPEVAGGVVVGNKKDAVTKREEPETNGDSMQAIQQTTVTTKS